MFDRGGPIEVPDRGGWDFGPNRGGGGVTHRLSQGGEHVLYSFFNRTVVEAGFERVASSSRLPIKEKEAVYDSDDYLPVVLQV